MAADNDGLCPARHQTRHIPADDRFTEDRAAQNIADGPVRRFPHLLEIEFFHPRFIRRDSGTFNTYAMASDRHRRVDRNLIVGFVALLDAEIVIFELDLEIRQNQFLLNELPDHAGHLVAVEFDHGIRDLDFGHETYP